MDGLGETGFAGAVLDAFDEEGSESGEAALGEDGEGFDDKAVLIRIAKNEADELVVVFSEESAVGSEV